MARNWAAVRGRKNCTSTRQYRRLPANQADFAPLFLTERSEFLRRVIAGMAILRRGN